MSRIIYTKTDEAPALATYSLLPIVRSFASAAGISVELKDISLAGRILSQFPEYLKAGQRVEDALAELGELVKTPQANIIKLPNISASVPQIIQAVRELQAKGFALPDYPENPSSDEERDVRARYDRVKGSAVNPVIREGNSDRRAPRSVKNYARKHPHSMGAWSKDSRTHVASMEEGDFYGSEQSLTMDRELTVRIELSGAGGRVQLLKEGLRLNRGQIVDAARMSRKALRSFFRSQIEEAQRQGILFSLHLKATMMKVSDPIIFGHALEEYFAPLFASQGPLLAELGFSSRNGLGDLVERMKTLDETRRKQLEAAIESCYSRGPDLAMVDSDRGITNFHVPSDIIIDASMPAAIRTSGQMWGPDGKARDMKAVIPDRSYAGVYQAVIEDCKLHGALDPAHMGSVANVGLMAQKAEEYGSHDKTFEIPFDGEVRVLGPGDELLFHLSVEEGDIFRMCQVEDAAVQDWIRLAIRRSQESAQPLVFWLDENRAHDRQLIAKLQSALTAMGSGIPDHQILSPPKATLWTLEQLRQGRDVISATGNVLRDYLTDLFPIMELGTSAKMLSIVPLMNGGGLFETGAGGSAPKHVQQFIKEGHLRWDSLGEFLALVVSLEHYAKNEHNTGAAVLASCLDRATERLLDEGRSPGRTPDRLDNRGSHVYLALYWAQELASQKDDPGLARRFAPLAEQLGKGLELILSQIRETQGQAQDIGGYYAPDEDKVVYAMRPSPVFNGILEQFIGTN